jgi:cob(I)alamin adenosyltransferase
MNQREQIAQLGKLRAEAAALIGMEGNPIRRALALAWLNRLGDLLAAMILAGGRDG